MLNFVKTALSSPKVDMLGTITPSNHQSAKQEWLEQAKNGNFTNPQFEYSGELSAAKASLSEWSKICSEWEEKFSPHAAGEKLLHMLVSDYLERQRTIRLIAVSIALGDESMTDCLMAKYYGKTDKQLIKFAYQLANGEATVDFPYLDHIPQKLSAETAEACKAKEYVAEDIKHMFDAVLEDYRLQDTWKVVIDDSRSAICVSSFTADGDSRVYIPTTRKVNEIKAIQLAGHEIENHVRHNENCISLLSESFDIPRDIAARLVTDRDGKFTEGFAKMSDAVIAKRCFGTNNGTPEPWYIIMADLANKGESFAQITEKVHTEWGVSLESCWTHAIRIFRGCLNTRNKHNFAREADRSYLEGYIRAIELAKENSLLVDFAKFDEDIMAKISNLIGDPRKHIKLPLLDIANKIVSSL